MKRTEWERSVARRKREEEDEDDDNEEEGLNRHGLAATLGQKKPT